MYNNVVTSGLMAAEKRKYTTITIPSKLFERISKNIKNTGFSSVSDYATYILRETTFKIEEAKGKKGAKAEKDYIVDKLRALGYVE